MLKELARGKGEGRGPFVKGFFLVLPCSLHMKGRSFLTAGQSKWPVAYRLLTHCKLLHTILPAFCENWNQIEQRGFSHTSSASSFVGSKFKIP